MTEPTTDLEPYVSSAPATLFGTDETPQGFVNTASEYAKALKNVVDQRGLTKRIGNKDHVLVEAWTMLGSMLGVYPIVVWTRELEDHTGWEARVEARTRAGEVVGAAEAECRRAESNWAKRDSFALRSMAQTRATSKALRAPLGFIVELAGYNPTPAEEMGVVDSKPVGGSLKPTKAQHAKLAMLLKESDESPEKFPLPPQPITPETENDYVWENWTDYAKSYARETFGVSTRADLTREQMSKLIEHIDQIRIPFS
jgi:hypothetical protein